MSDLRELYQSLILDHNRQPRNFGILEPCSHHARGNNPLCGDQLDIYIQCDSEKIIAIQFSGSGCAISKASASLMTEATKNKTQTEARALFEKFHNLLTLENNSETELGKLQVFAGVKEFPMRVKCATLAWHTLIAALDEKQEVSTES